MGQVVHYEWVYDVQVVFIQPHTAIPLRFVMIPANMSRIYHGSAAHIDVELWLVFSRWASEDPRGLSSLHECRHSYGNSLSQVHAVPGCMRSDTDKGYATLDCGIAHKPPDWIRTIVHTTQGRRP